MNLKEKMEKSNRALKAEDFKKVEASLKGAIESDALTKEKADEVRSTLKTLKGRTTNDVVNLIVTLTLLLNLPEIMAFHAALGVHIERRLDSDGIGRVIREALKKAGMKDDLDEVEETLKSVMKDVEA